MKIAVVSTVHDIRDPRLSLKTAGSLARSGYPVDLIAGVSSGNDTETARAFMNHLPKGVNPVLLDANTGKLHRINRQLEVLQRLDLQQTHLLYIHDPELIPLAEWVRFRHNIPYLFDLHEDVFDPSGLRWEFLQRLVSHAFRSADGIVTAFRLDPRPYHPQPKVPFAEILNYYSDVLISDSYIHKINIPPKKAGYRLCYTGTIAPDRNITGLIRLVDHFISAGMDIELMVAGKIFMPHYLREIHSTLLNCRNKEYIHLLGGDTYIDWPTLQLIHKQSDAGVIFFHPDTLNWNYPSKLYEYLGTGLPVMCSDIPIIRELLNELQAGFFVPHDDPDQAFKEINKHLPVMVESDMEPAQKWISEHANWHKQEGKLLELVEHAIGE